MILTQEKLSGRGETHVIAALCVANPAWTGLGSDLDLCAMIRSLCVNCKVKGFVIVFILNAFYYGCTQKINPKCA
jgi:hypothetical protein